jgi:hypothetical protein
MIGMWCFLPSPAIPPQRRDTYIQNRLASGNTVITALDYLPFMRSPHSIHSGECPECSDLLIHWRLLTRGRDVLIRLSDYDDREAINMTGIIRESIQWDAGKSPRSKTKWRMYFTDHFTVHNIPGGSADEEINLPWFHTVDQALNHYNMHGFGADVMVRVLVPEPGVLEIWKGAFVDGAVKATPYTGPPKSPMDSTYEYMMLHKSETDLLASFQITDGLEPVVVKHLAGYLPSRTYPIRKALLFPLGPFIAIPFILFSELTECVSPFFYFIVVGLGLLVGFVCYLRIREGGSVVSALGGLCWPLQFVQRRQRKNRRNNRHVWGATGPVDMKKQRSWLNEESEVGLQRPETVRLERDWKE